jgi:hypothetical protein
MVSKDAQEPKIETGEMSMEDVMTEIQNQPAKPNAHMQILPSASHPVSVTWVLSL